MLDPYQILRLDRDATADEIKASYRKLAKELHPDLNPGNATKARRFKEVTAAYNVLSDETRRRQYDAEHDNDLLRKRAGAGGDARRSWANPFEQSSESAEEAVKARAQRRRGADIYRSLRISLAESLLGGRRRLTVQDERAIDVSIPPMTESGQSLRLKGQGGKGSLFGPAGDLFVEISVEPHPHLTRSNNDILMTLPVTVQEAVLGATITVPTLQGLVQLKIPSYSNTDTVLRLRGKGVPGTGANPAGDQLVTLKIVLPGSRDREFAELVAEWGPKNAYTVRPGYGD